MSEKNTIKSFTDLDVYKGSYTAMLNIMEKIIPALPLSEKYDLTSQLSRSAKAIPRLIAEGYAKRHQKMGFQKYLDDAMAECNETVVSLCQCRDIYFKDKKEFLEVLIDDYDKFGRQLYKLRNAWSDFKTNNHRRTTTRAS